MPIPAIDATSSDVAWASEVTSSVLGTGAVRGFERQVAERTSVEFALALPSATTAIRLALKALGVGPGSDVVLPAYDWPASVAAVLDVGAVPHPVDIILPEATIDPDAVRAALSHRTRAVVATHLHGIPARVAELRSVCDDAGIPLLEDCSQALGTVVDGRPVGSYGLVGIFSFGPGKIIDAGEAGVMVTASIDLWRQAIRLSQHPARQIASGIRDPDRLALQTRVHPAAALSAVRQFADLDARLTRRRAHRETVLAALRDAPEGTFPSAGSLASGSGDGVPIVWGSGMIDRADVGHDVVLAPAGGMLLGNASDAPRAQRAASALRIATMARPSSAAVTGRTR